MILLDTHICIWWTMESDRLSEHHRKTIEATERDGIAVSAITVWEVGLLAARGRVSLSGSAQQWLDRLRSMPTIHIIPADPQILLDSTQLPGEFHKDPADRIIVATARSLGTTLLTSDGLILAYPHVQAIGPNP